MLCKCCGRFIEVEDYPTGALPSDHKGRCYFCYSAGLQPVTDEQEEPDDELDDDAQSEDDHGDLSDEEMGVDDGSEEN